MSFGTSRSNRAIIALCPPEEQTWESLAQPGPVPACNPEELKAHEAGVAEPGGARGATAPPPPPKNLSGWAKVCFGPPKISTTGPPPPKWAASGQTPCQIASENPEMCKIFQIFRLRWAYYMGRNYSSGDFMLF